MKYTQQEKDEAIAELRKLIPPATTVYTVLTHVSASGMSRDIKCLIATNEAKETGTLMTHETNKPTINHWENTKIIDIGWLVARVLDLSLAKKNEWSVKIKGCGMDMGFHLVTSLSYALGYNNDESGKITGRPDGKTNAYGLNHQWL